MKRVHRVGMIAVFSAAMAVATAFAGNVTVGRFYVELAKAKNLAATDAISAETNLRQAGFNLPKLALDKGLSEGDLKSISSTLGLAVTTERPTEPITEAQLNTFMASFATQLKSPTLGDPNPADVLDLPPQSGKGKGKKKGHHKSSTEPI